MRICICEFPEMCDGSGRVFCLGCGGDQCVCRGCMGQGESDCDGCEMCDPRDDEGDSDE